MKKTPKKYDFFKMEEATKTGRVVTVGYCVYRVEDGERFKSYIPTAAMAREYRDRMNAEAAKQTA